MVPLISYTTVSGIPVTQLLDKASSTRSSHRNAEWRAEIGLS